MSETSHNNLPEDDDGSSPENLQADLPHDLPPVEPPSAGMIIQLFVVPAVIVAVIVGVYALFGKLAAQELDWRQLVTDVKSENPHVRWRGALGLAQMLDADRQRGDSTQNLAANPEIATALAELYEEYIPLTDLNEEELKNLEFLSKALGRMSVQDVIVPVFREGIQEDRDREVRKHSLIGLAMLAGNVNSSGNTVRQTGLVDELIRISRESDRLFRHQASYILGLIPSEKGKERLVAMLNDPDQMTRINAAVALARQDSTQGVTEFQGLIEEATSWQLDPSSVTTQEEEAVYFERMLMLTNALKAISLLDDKLNQEQRAKLLDKLNQLSADTKDVVVKSQTLELMKLLNESS